MKNESSLIKADPIKGAQNRLSEAISILLNSRDYREGNGKFTVVYGFGNDRQLIYVYGHPIARWINDNQRDFPTNITQHTQQKIFYSQKYFDLLELYKITHSSDTHKGDDKALFSDGGVSVDTLTAEKGFCRSFGESEDARALYNSSKNYGSHEIEISDYFKDMHSYASDSYKTGHFELGDFLILDVTDKPEATYVNLAWQKINKKNSKLVGYHNLQHKKYEISATVKRGLISIDQVASDELNEVMHLQGLLKSKPELFTELFASGKTLHNYCQNNLIYTDKISKYIDINSYLAKNFPLIRPEKIYQDIYVKTIGLAVEMLSKIK